MYKDDDLTRLQKEIPLFTLTLDIKILEVTKEASEALEL